MESVTVSTGKSVFGWIEGPEEIGGGEQDAPSSSSVFMTQVPTNTCQESFNCVYLAFDSSYFACLELNLRCHLCHDHNPDIVRVRFGVVRGQWVRVEDNSSL